MPKRQCDRSVELEDLGYGNHEPFTGRLGRTGSRIEEILQDQTVSGAAREFVPVIPRSFQAAVPKMTINMQIYLLSAQTLHAQCLQLTVTGAKGVSKQGSSRACTGRKIFLSTSSDAAVLLQMRCSAGNSCRARSNMSLLLGWIQWLSTVITATQLSTYSPCCQPSP